MKIIGKIVDYAVGMTVFFGLAGCESFTYWLDSTIDNSVIEIIIVALAGLSAVLLKTVACRSIGNYIRRNVKNLVREAVFKD